MWKNLFIDNSRAFQDFEILWHGFENEARLVMFNLALKNIFAKNRPLKVYGILKALTISSGDLKIPLKVDFAVDHSSYVNKELLERYKGLFRQGLMEPTNGNFGTYHFHCFFRKLATFCKFLALQCEKKFSSRSFFIRKTLGFFIYRKFSVLDNLYGVG